MHLRATQALLAAETFGAIADATGRRDPNAWRAQVRARTAAIHAGWTTLVPGNHHDFITGTALDPVYETEQLPRLATALAQGEAARTTARAGTAAALKPAPPGGRRAPKCLPPSSRARRTGLRPSWSSTRSALRVAGWSRSPARPLAAAI